MIPELFDLLISEASFTVLQYVPLFYGIGSLTFIQLIGQGDGEPYRNLHYHTIPSFLSILIWGTIMIDPKGINGRIITKIMDFLSLSPN